MLVVRVVERELTEYSDTARRTVGPSTPRGRSDGTRSESDRHGDALVIVSRARMPVCNHCKQLKRRDASAETREGSVCEEAEQAALGQAMGLGPWRLLCLLELTSSDEEARCSDGARDRGGHCGTASDLTRSCFGSGEPF